MICWSNSGKIFSERWLCDNVSDELIARETDANGRVGHRRVVYYVCICSGGLTNPTEYTHLVDVDHFCTDYWHLAATLFQEANEGNELFRAPVWINNLGPDRQEHFRSVMTYALQRMMQKSLKVLKEADV